MKGAGGTQGGVTQFFVGLAMAGGGAVLLTPPATATSPAWGFFGFRPFALALLPLVVGAALLFFDGRSRLGRVLTFGGAFITFLGVLLSSRTCFEPTSLVDTLMTLAFFVAGLGLVARSLRPRRGSGDSRGGDDEGR